MKARWRLGEDMKLLDVASLAMQLKFARGAIEWEMIDIIV